MLIGLRIGLARRGGEAGVWRRVLRTRVATGSGRSFGFTANVTLYSRSKLSNMSAGELVCKETEAHRIGSRIEPVLEMQLQPIPSHLASPLSVHSQHPILLPGHPSSLTFARDE